MSVAVIVGTVLWWINVSIGLLLFISRTVYMIAGCFYPGLLRKVTNRLAPMLPDTDVCIQIPLYNERYHTENAIRYACALKWPYGRKIILVCDDSSDPECLRLVDLSADRACEEGHEVVVVRREHRQGYKAGSLNYSLQLLDKQVPYVTILDADFRPQEDFLQVTVPYLAHDKRVAFIMVRWSFYNAFDNLLTRLQAPVFSYLYRAEHSGRYALGLYTNFTGTAGVWKVDAIDSLGGWGGDTVTEDHDLATQAYLAGWNYVVLSRYACDSELPASFKAYLTQQFRWTCGPSQVLVKNFPSLFKNQVSLARRLRFIYVYFFFWILPGIQFFTLLASVGYALWVVVTGVQGTDIPWQYYFFAMLSFSTSAQTFIYDLESLFLFPFYASIETGLSWFRTKAMISGYLGTKRSMSWEVTAKTNGIKDHRWTLMTWLKNVMWVELIFSGLCAYLGINLILLGFVLWGAGLLFMFISFLSVGLLLYGNDL